MATYATLDPANKGANITLSGGNLVMTAGVAGWQSVGATIAVSSGKWYWEVVWNSGLNYLFPGISYSPVPINSYVGSDANSWSYNPVSGSVYHNGTESGTGATWTTGDTIGMALDVDGGTLDFYKNNALQHTITGLSGTIYPAFGTYGTTAQSTVNFGASALTYTPPSGYNAGVYTGGASTQGLMMMF